MSVCTPYIVESTPPRRMYGRRRRDGVRTYFTMEYSVFVSVNTATEDCVPVNSPVGHQDTLIRGCIVVTYVRI